MGVCDPTTPQTPSNSAVSWNVDACSILPEADLVVGGVARALWCHKWLANVAPMLEMITHHHHQVCVLSGFAAGCYMCMYILVALEDPRSIESFESIEP